MYTDKGSIFESEVIVLPDNEEPKQHKIKEIIQMSRIMSNNTQILQCLHLSHNNLIGPLNNGIIMTIILRNFKFQLTHQTRNFLTNHPFNPLIKATLNQTTFLITLCNFALIIFNPTNRSC